jgi:uncharacterized protein YdhG (YjbR/CyaY superfamily)
VGPSSSSDFRKKPKDIDEYLATMPDSERAALQELRKVIHAAAPEAVEAFVYGVPGFKLGRRPLAAFAGFKNHCGFYPLSVAVIRAHAEELTPYDTSEGTIRFKPEDPLPSALVVKLVKARAAELMTELEEGKS